MSKPYIVEKEHATFNIFNIENFVKLLSEGSFLMIAFTYIYLLEICHEMSNWYILIAVRIRIQSLLVLFA